VVGYEKFGATWEKGKAYAVPVHERLGVRHPVGEAKFLENGRKSPLRRIREVSPETPRAGETVSVGDDFVQYLTELGIGTPGINLWLGGVPDRAAAITVVETGGPAPYHDYGPGEVIDHPSVQILVRNPAYLLARDKADQIRDAFDGLANWRSTAPLPLRHGDE